RSRDAELEALRTRADLLAGQVASAEQQRQKLAAELVASRSVAPAAGPAGAADDVARLQAELAASRQRLAIVERTLGGRGPEPAAGGDEPPEARARRLALELDIVQQERDAARSELEAAMRRAAELEARPPTAAAGAAAGATGGSATQDGAALAELEASRARVAELEGEVARLREVATQSETAIADGGDGEEAEADTEDEGGNIEEGLGEDVAGAPEEPEPQADDTSAELAALRQERDGLRARVAELEPALEQASAERDRLAAEAGAAAAKVAGQPPPADLTRVVQEAERLRTDGARLASHNTRLQAELEQAKGEVGRLRREVETAVATAAKAGPQAAGGRPAAAAAADGVAGNEPGGLRAELDAVLVRVRDLDGKLAEARERNAQLESFLSRRAPAPAPAPRREERPPPS
ncbi:MAG TPA: hypothetical protein VF606_06135, partial [Geminicoccaceae bacterium]